MFLLVNLSYKSQSSSCYTTYNNCEENARCIAYYSCAQFSRLFKILKASFSLVTAV